MALLLRILLALRALQVIFALVAVGLGAYRKRKKEIHPAIHITADTDSRALCQQLELEIHSSHPLPRIRLFSVRCIVVISRTDLSFPDNRSICGCDKPSSQYRNYCCGSIDLGALAGGLGHLCAHHTKNQVLLW